MDEAQITAWVKRHKKELVGRVIENAVPQEEPVAYIMAGIPGAGKTELLNHIVTEYDNIVIVDLDKIVTMFNDYRAEDYYRYRRAGNLIVSDALKQVFRNRYNLALDGTFTHSRGARNIEKALECGYHVALTVVYQLPDIAWRITEARRKVTGRPIERDGFIRACHSLVPKVQEAIQAFSANERFHISIVVKNSLNEFVYYEGKRLVDRVLKIMYAEYTKELKVENEPE